MIGTRTKRSQAKQSRNRSSEKDGTPQEHITLPIIAFADHFEVDKNKKIATALFFKEYRKTNKLSQAALAKKLEVTINAVFMIEDMTFRLTKTHIEKIEKKLNVKIANYF